MTCCQTLSCIICALQVFDKRYEEQSDNGVVTSCQASSCICVHWQELSRGVRYGQKSTSVVICSQLLTLVFSVNPFFAIVMRRYEILTNRARVSGGKGGSPDMLVSLNVKDGGIDVSL